ncbi:MAG TPA: TIGR03013 family PEP-CTERM/XrtA system glycosyltransferase [Gammaproteobacteria bacterium]|nr:TIGR03013 family PEP-CTERM/XrtA system glycosyltransferase [Gammaproteobacteria bacterium]
MLTKLRVAPLVLILDVIGLVSAFYLIQFIRLEGSVNIDSTSMLLITVLVLSVEYLSDTYSIETYGSIYNVSFRAIIGVVISGLLISIYLYARGPFINESPLFWRSVLPFSLMAFAVWAGLCRAIVSKIFRDMQTHQRWLVLANSTHAEQLADDFKKIKSPGELVLFPDIYGDVSGDKHSTVTMETLKGIEDSLLEDRVSGVIIATDRAFNTESLNKLMHFRLQGLKIYDIAEFYEELWSKVPIFHVEDGWFIRAAGFGLIHHKVAMNIKRVVDLIMAISVFILTAPLLLFVAVLIMLDSRGPALYIQDRTGVKGKTFRLYKFRTMKQDAEKNGAKWASENDPRVTTAGKFLRKSRIDELPQLWNVIIGDMSFIGPRPERPGFVKKLEEKIPYYDMRHLVKPGITGWAQVMYRYGSSVEDAIEKLQYDIFYIKNYSLILDLVITMKTLRVIVWGSGR